MKILIAGHGELPEALLSSARMIGGALPDVTSIGLFPGETPQDFRGRLLSALQESCPEVVLTDLAGGTPDNVANLSLKGGQVPTVRWIIAGVSLPLLLEFALSSSAAEADPDAIIQDTGAVIRYTNPEPLD